MFGFLSVDKVLPFTVPDYITPFAATGRRYVQKAPLHCPQDKPELSGGTGRTAEQCCKVHPGFCSAVTEQSGSNLPSSCSHQQTVYCKKVAGSKAKRHSELKAYLLKKPEAVHAYEKSVLHMRENHILTLKGQKSTYTKT